MPARIATDEQILEVFTRNRSISGTAGIIGISERALQTRLRQIENRTGEPIRQRSKPTVTISRNTRPNPINIEDGIVMVCSDCHYWPGEPSDAHKAFVRLAKQLKPDIIVVNGDEFDGASISSHARIGWEHRPTVNEELKACVERMGEIKAASRAVTLGTYGNHTKRFDSYLAGNAPALEGVRGATYDDHFADWNYGWAWLINGHTIVKHRMKGGIHATWNNTADAQISTVTGHLHNLRITPRTTMAPTNGGNLYGVDTGMLADPWGAQFAYLEQGQRNWRSGFAVLTFKKSILLPPELCQIVGEGEAYFRGSTFEV